MDTVVQLDPANRVQSVTRGFPGSAARVTANYTYFDNGLVHRIDYGNNTATVYTYDDANRVKTISHVKVVNAMEQAALMMTYSYNQRDLPTLIVESSALGGPIATVTFIYDDRGRLTSEQRTGDHSYLMSYSYDLGGNRRHKVDYGNSKSTEYFYDIDDPATYNSANNRLMKTETVDITTCNPATSSCPLLSTDYYLYNFAGNVTRVITESANPLVGEPVFKATRYVYARNARTVSYVLGETWNVDAAGVAIDYTVTFAREFRYDGARQRYLDRELDPNGLQVGQIVPVSETWSDYDGDNNYGDFTVAGGVVTQGRQYQAGVGMIDDPTGSPVTKYLHNNHLGTLRTITTATGGPDQLRVFTAFGEPITNATPHPDDRYGYVGALGYQAPTSNTTGDPYANSPYLHVGARYYDPATGRFLQRDPIGIRGGFNVYAYVENAPTMAVDPSGNMRIPVKGRDVPSGSRGTLKWPGRFGSPTPTIVPWYRPNFSFRSPQVMMCVAAAAVGAGVGYGINKGVQAATGKSLSDRIGEAWFRWRNGGQCPGC